MLKVDCNAVLNNNKSILIDSESVGELLNTLDSQYSALDASVKAKASINTGNLRSMVSNELENKVSFLSKMVSELEEAMGESMDQLIKHNYSEDIYEDKIIAFYTDHWYNFDKNLETHDEAYSHFYVLDYFYDFWHEGQGKDEKFRLYLNIRKFQDKFDYDRFKMDVDKVRQELVYIYNARGSEEMRYVMNALLNNCPDNYEDFNFNPGAQVQSNGHYDYDGRTIGNYQTNSELININGYTFDFAQVLPKDCTSIEMLAYDFCKANVINTMRCFPDKYLEAAAQKNNVIVLTCAHEAMDDDRDSWGGYYDEANFAYPEDGNVIIDAHGSLYANNYYTIDIVIHEFGHKFDDILNGWGKFDNLLSGYSLTDHSKEWHELYNKYKGLLPDIILEGYSEEGFEAAPAPFGEFFAEAMVAYFLDPDALKKMCEANGYDLYNVITELLGEDCGGCYSENIDEIIAEPYNTQSSGNGYPELKPGVGPLPEPTPGPEGGI